MTANALVLAGYGLNCEEETLHAFKHVGLSGEIIHINDLTETPSKLDNAQILVVPGGFSYGDDTGSGNAFAQKMRLSLWEELLKFIERDTLTLGICNGCQILANLGLIPNADGNRTVAVTYNENARYQCRWVEITVNKENTSPWLQGLGQMHIPVAHGEGRFMMDEEVLAMVKDQIAFQYIKPLPSSRTAQPEGSPSIQGDPSSQAPQDDDFELAQGQFPHNPNGSVQDIAAMTDKTGRILAMMPHPERGMFTWQRDDYDALKDAAQRTGQPLPEEADGMALFHNAAQYFGVKKKEAA